MTPDLFTAVQLRDKAIARVSDGSNAWIRQALGLIEQMPIIKTTMSFEAVAGMAFTGEDLRVMLRERGLPDPHHPNCYGALINIALRRKLLQPIGRYVRMRNAKSHARKTPEYIRI